MTSETALEGFSRLIRAMYEHPALRNTHVTSTIAQPDRVVIVTKDLRDITVAISDLAQYIGFETVLSTDTQNVQRLIITLKKPK